MRNSNDAKFTFKLSKKKISHKLLDTVPIAEGRKENDMLLQQEKSGNERVCTGWLEIKSIEVEDPMNPDSTIQTDIIPALTEQIGEFHDKLFIFDQNNLFCRRKFHTVY